MRFPDIGNILNRDFYQPAVKMKLKVRVKEIQIFDSKHLIETNYEKLIIENM